MTEFTTEAGRGEDGSSGVQERSTEYGIQNTEYRSQKIFAGTGTDH
jgi:hypothetical protein